MKIWEKEVIINQKYTRWIDREYTELLQKNIKIKTYKEDWKEIQEFGWDYAMNTWIANDYLVLAMTNLTKEDIDNLSIEEYDLLFNEINKITKKVPTVA